MKLIAEMSQEEKIIYLQGAKDGQQGIYKVWEDDTKAIRKAAAKLLRQRRKELELLYPTVWDPGPGTGARVAGLTHGMECCIANFRAFCKENL